jgi:glycosyltransferase involved in cell wall biosynthesis
MKPHPPRLSIVIPAKNEAGNLTPLCEEIDSAMREAGLTYQIVIIDDGSTDGTAEELRELSHRFPTLMFSHHEKSLGQSASLRSGFALAEASLIGTLDADLQNVPGDLPLMVEQLLQQGADLVQGDRCGRRRDHWGRRAASAIGRTTRRLILSDDIRDSGCATRVMRRAVAEALPLDQPGMHRFIPTLAKGLGFKVIQTPASHRPRIHGVTKYGTGPIKRGLPGLRDCFRVRRMLHQSNVDAIATATPGAAG